ncbi:ATP-dependent RNA helicase Dbp8 [Schizosaccharomyces japonicus yFS275]|uniref:ATP-dependent RNA helicase Dbp8 n=1 Tax=Schizosaccharomyces japonicus (strain yFS275 / FY16936) TaxID=402676 RepID=B6JZZ3_SCHJY|nr:ATP-dependent RNA helicase Dbp8 [Schizosaccharomyces japonicus yFS275]EEB06143.1 ATP-dependent RNA helicase Dbp8 [Schizosaccharomyces japonicus yFS275]
MTNERKETFGSLGISPWLVETLQAVAIQEPTPIQKGVIKKVLEGADCIGGAKTGSGKTIAFALPILEKWARDPFGTFAVILTPTRELAIQIDEQFAALGAPMNLKHILVVGGMDMVAQAIALSKRPHIVVATPGRLADLIRSNGEETYASLHRTQFVVFDEADRLLSPTFADDLDDCLEVLPPPEKRQTLLFTATMTDAIRALKDREPHPGKPPLWLYEVDTEGVSIPESLEQHYLLVASHVRDAYLVQLLSSPENEDKSVIVFANRTYTVELLYRMLRLLDFRVTCLHSEMAQRERVNSLGRFRAEAARVLIATDVASRGLDIPSVKMVVNYDIPRDPDDYVHRVGRAARVGRFGESVSFVTEHDVDLIHAIEDRVGKQMTAYESFSENKMLEKLKQINEAKRKVSLELVDEDFGSRRKKLKEKRMMMASKVQTTRKHSARHSKKKASVKTKKSL